MLSEPIVAFVNHLLEPAAWARGILAGHAGKTAVFQFFPVSVGVTVAPDGRLQPAPDGARADVTIQATPATALQLLAEGEDAWRKAAVDGDTAFASAIAKVAANLQWDVEEDLSKVIGDIAARRLALAGRAAAQWPKQAAGNAAASIAEYLTEEKHVLVTPLQAAEFLRNVDELRDAVERLDKRIERLQRQGGGA